MYKRLELITLCTATITLTPLTIRSDPDDFVRILRINPSKTTIVVGRASKNVDKGLVAAKQNAWFDSPIMSRKHAVFSINPVTKVSNKIVTLNLKIS